MKKTIKFYSLLLAFCIMLSASCIMLSFGASAAEGTTIDLSTLTQDLNFYDSKTYSLDGGTTKQSYEGSITLTGSTGFSVLFNGGTNDVIFNNVSIVTQKTKVVHLEREAALNLTLKGDNLLKNTGGNNSTGWPGLSLSHESTLTVIKESTGKLTAIGGYGAAGIGGYNNSITESYINILGGTVVATGGSGGAGIGSGSMADWEGTITISDANVTAKSESGSAAGIGSGFCGGNSNFTVSIKNSTVVASGKGAGIGCGYGQEGYVQKVSISIEDSTVLATGFFGAGIGAAENCKFTDITIKNSTVTASSYIDNASGIGGFNPIEPSWVENGTITIDNSTVTASGGNLGAGIGGGCGSITVKSSTVTASGGNLGAGIGGGYKVSNGPIVIDGSNINASGYRPIGAGDIGTNTAPKNTAGNELTLTTVTLDKVTNDIPVTKVEGATGYGTVDLKTIGGKLYLYLPAGDSPTKVVANGNEYSGTVTDGAGTFTFAHTCNVGTEGTPANCSYAAICGTCLQYFGEKDLTNHNVDNANWTQENDKHYHACLNGCGIHFDEMACSGDTTRLVNKDDVTHGFECSTCKGLFSVEEHIFDTYVPAHDGDDHSKHKASCECGNFTYKHHDNNICTASGNVITVTCSSCRDTDTVTVNATGKIYDGTPVDEATVSHSWGYDISAQVKYFVKGSDEALDSLPIAIGTYEARLTLGSDEYGQATAIAEFTISKSIPDVGTLPTGLEAIYGDTLGSVELPSGWAWKDASLSVGNAGEKTFTAIFTPADTENYAEVERELTVTVGKAPAPEIEFPTAAEIIYGQPLSEVALDGGSTELGSFAFENGTIVPSMQNSYYKLVFTPSAEALNNYENIGTAEKMITVPIAKRDITITANSLTVCIGVNPAPYLTFTVDGLIEGDVLLKYPTLSVDTDGKTAGSFTVTASDAYAGENYRIAVYVEGLVTVREHEFGDWEKHDEEMHKKVCKHCEFATSTGHSWNEGEMIDPPTCEEPGEQLFTCTVCGETKTEHPLATGHLDGNGDGKCDDCGYGASDGTTSLPDGTTSVPEGTTPAEPDKNDGLDTGAIIGIAAGSVLALGAAGFAGYWFVIRKRK